MHAFGHRGKNRRGSIYTRGHGYTLLIDTAVERLEIRPHLLPIGSRPHLLPIGSRRHETLIARPTRSNIRDEEDGKHMSYIQAQILVKEFHAKHLHTHVQYVLLAYPRYYALAESKPLGITCQWTLIRTNNVQLLPGHLREDTKIQDQSMEFDLMDRFFSDGNNDLRKFSMGTMHLTLMARTRRLLQPPWLAKRWQLDWCERAELWVQVIGYTSS
jgi:hypothetical protein